MGGGKRWWQGLVALTAVVVVLALACGDFCPLTEQACPLFGWTWADLAELIRSQGHWGMAVAVGLMVLHSFAPFPAEILTVANGAVYGPWLGSLVTWVGAMLGAFASFGLTRWLGRPFVERFLPPRHLASLDHWTARQGTGTLLLSRLLPIISFNLINYAVGLTRVSWWTFAWTTGLGIIPMTVLMVVMGSRLHLLPWWGWLLGLPLLAGMYLLWRQVGQGSRRGGRKDG